MGVLEHKARARLFYKYLSKVYDQVNPYIWNEDMRAEALELIDIQDGDRVLDVGCGTGFATEGLLQYTDDVHGLDQSIHQLEKAWAKLGKHETVKFYRGDAERLPFRDGQFDKVWSSGSIEYWPEPVKALREIRRVVKPGNKVLIVGPNHPQNFVMGKLADAMMLFYDEAEADRMFSEAGFVDIEHTLMGPQYSPEIAIVTVARAPEK
ncbi:methyltransferase domain-containing protein [Haladaptatus sp. ZSTT2]|uniref:methyltransferase domain-containing protein n=1 Tax=Haladaptatus sp. ZSTT2 TaxID=3120515 RepID=UPI00300ED915